ncbi:type I restriction endonuclease subunit R [Pseudomonas putida]|nr:type I restriction endonuclease subunit R [Pseudomonas putida]
MEKYPAYQKYKKTRCAWLQEIPEHWDFKRLKNVVSCNDEALDERTDPDLEIEYVDISSVSLVNGIEKTETMPFEKAPSRARRKVKDGDIIVSTVRTYLKAIAPICEPPENMVVSTGFAVVRPKNNLFSGFAGYLLQSNGFVGDVVANSVGVSYPAINASDLVRIPAVEPPLEEQKAIARFLDFKIAQIDSLIAKKKSLLDKLTEKRTALISHAVTKGLDQTVQMKSSGIEWIGNIPRHWSIRRIKFAAKLESGHTPSKQVPEYWEDCDIPWVSLNDSKQLSAVDYISETAIQINSLGLANSSARLLPANAVVFTRDATIGLSAITTRTMAVSQHLIAWIPGLDITSLYLLRVFSAMKGFLDSFTFGATIKTIGMPDVKRLAMPIPPREEQEVITAFIDEQLRTISPQIRAIEIAIDKLTEYRSALITGAVTGQIDVRGFETPQP